MYRWFVRRRVCEVFRLLSTGDFEGVLPGLSPAVHHTFAGDHALGGERHSREAVRRWFERLFRLFPALSFDVRQILVAGPPWDLYVTVEWLAHVTPAAGTAYENTGAHVLRIKRGRVVCLHAYEDSQAVAAACARMSEAGIAEAAAAPVVAA